MDTKWRSMKYSNKTKGIAVFLVWLCLMSAAVSGVFLLYNEDIVSSSSFYDTRDFQYEFSRSLHNAVEYHLSLRHETDKAGEETHAVASEVQERSQFIEDRLSNMVNFAYYIRNTESGEIFSNISRGEALAQLKKQPSYTFMNSKGEGSYRHWYSEDISNMLSKSKSEVHGAVMEPLKEGDQFYEQFARYSSVKGTMPYAIILLCISLAIALAAFIYLIYVAGRKEENDEIINTAVDKIYTDVHALLVLIAAIASLTAVGEVSNGADTAFFIATGVIFGIDLCIGLSFIFSMVRQIKSGQILKNSLIYKCFATLKKYAVYALNGKMFKAWIILALLGYGFANSILMAVFISTSRHGATFDFLVSCILLLGFNFAAVYLAAKALRNIAQLMEAAKEISTGNLDYSIDKSGMSVAFVGFAENLQGIQRGLQKAVSEAVKGERMKTELITNVSHDLKTPLTSIINYVDLLKKEELDNQKAAEYLLILDEKSARLKQLIEDLIEASKASSGNLAVAAEKVDLYQLVMQAYGEYEEKIEKAGLDIRTNIVEKDIFVRADGKHLWRIIENLLSNALKYSMANSRVYINIDKNEKYGLLTIKNISAFPLEISPEQLTERFVRGDASRTTEGSGLGLSIAQSLTNLQGGKFKVEIDGDLFKVTVELPIWLGE